MNHTLETLSPGTIQSIHAILHNEKDRERECCHVNHHSRSTQDRSRRRHHCLNCRSDTAWLVSDSASICRWGLFTSHRAVRFAPAGTLFWDIAVCVGQSDWADPTVSDHWLLSRWSAGRSLSPPSRAVYIDNGRCVSDRDDPFDFTPHSQLVAVFLC